MDNRSIKENILKLREERKLTQEHVADIMGITSNAYWGIETGKTQLISKRIFQIAKIFDVSVNDIIYGHDIEKEILTKFLEENQGKYEKEKASAIKDLQSEIESLKAQLHDKEKIIRLMEEVGVRK